MTLCIRDKYQNLMSLPISHRVGGNRKRYQQSRNVDQKFIETVFFIAICRQCDDKWQSKTLFLAIFDLRSSIVFAFSIAAYPVCIYHHKVCMDVLLGQGEEFITYQWP